MNNNINCLIKPDYSNLKTFVINLDDYIENYIKQLPYLENIGLKIERFSGINALKDEHLKPEYKQYISNFALNFTPKSVIGNGLSHLLCCKHIYQNYINSDNNNIACGAISPQYFLIMEDDAFPKYNKTEFYKEINKTIDNIQILDSNWEIIQLHSDALYPTINTYTSHFLSGSVAAYLISKKGLNKIIKKKVKYHIDLVTINPFNFNKYRSRINLFYTNEKNSLNRNINKTKNISYYSLYFKSYLLELFNKYTNLLELRGEKTWQNFLEFKMLKLPYFKKEYTANELIDYIITLFLFKKYVYYLYKK